MLRLCRLVWHELLELFSCVTCLSCVMLVCDMLFYHVLCVCLMLAISWFGWFVVCCSHHVSWVAVCHVCMFCLDCMCMFCSMLYKTLWPTVILGQSIFLSLFNIRNILGSFLTLELFLLEQDFSMPEPGLWTHLLYICSFYPVEYNIKFSVDSMSARERHGEFPRHAV